MAQHVKKEISPGDPLRLALALGRIEKGLRMVRVAAVAVWLSLAAVRLIRAAHG